MSRRTDRAALRLLAALRRRQKARILRPRLEGLEDRTMLDSGGLPAAIVIGRTLSTPSTAATATPSPSYYMGDVQASNNQVAITITVYNEQANPETGVLVTDTLSSGVTLASASQPPDQSGQNLAWSLGTIQGYDRASVTITVKVPNASTLQLDAGAQAYAVLDAGAVSASTPAATLQPGSVSDPSLLASTVDADTNDPFIQEEAAALGYSPTQIFAYLHTQVGYNSYAGSVRGARGTLWSNAGNAVDTASLGVALMRASGIPAQYVSGTLSRSQAQTLILSMFPASYQTVGHVPAGTQTSDPANDPQLLSETESHDWFQFESGGVMTDADPLMPGATIGQTFTTSTGTFATVPQSLEATTEVQVVAEIYSQASALFGLGGQKDTTVLDQTFNDVQLVGRPLTLGFNVASNTESFILSATTNTYTPYIAWGDDAYNSTHDQIISGQSFQEALTSVPLGSSVLTGVFLNVTASGPQGASQTYSRTLFDRIGYAARQWLVKTSVSVAPGSAPAFSSEDAFTLDISAAAPDPHPAAERQAEMQADAAKLANASQQPADVAAAGPSLARGFDFAMTRELGNNFLTQSQLYTKALAAAADLAAYYARPRIVLISTQFINGSGTTSSNLTTAIDILNDSLQVEAPPGQAAQATFAFNFARGIFENLDERDSVAALSPNGQSAPVDNTYDVFTAAAAQGIGLITITSGNLSQLQGLNIPADAKARIATDVANGFGVLVPDQSVLLNGSPTIAWADVNLSTGEYIGVDANGGHEGLIEFVTDVGFRFRLTEYTLEYFSGVAGFDVGGILAVSYELNVAAGVSRPLAELKLVIAATEATEEYKKAIEHFAWIASGLSVAEDEKEFGEVIKGIVDVLLEDVRRPAGDPPLPGTLTDPLPLTTFAANVAVGSVAAVTRSTAGEVGASVRSAGLSVSGQMVAMWSSGGTSDLLAGSLNSAGATVTDGSGKAFGSGAVVVSASTPVNAAIAGTDQYALGGSGTLSFYGPSESTLGVSSDWQNYTATVTGDVSITLTVPAGALTLNGQALPAGTYTITTSSATLSGSGTTSSPTFSGQAEITATNGAVNLGPGTGTLSVGGKPLDPSDESTLDGYSGMITVSANGDGTDSVSLGGNAGNVLQVTTTQAALTTDQNTPVTIAANVLTSLADTYNLTANAPPGWAVTIDSKGNITATPAPGLQGGTYPIQIIAQSQTDANLEAQTTVEVTITPTQPGLNFTVAADPQFTVPYNGAQLPAAFRASMQNVGPAADTYNLTFSNVPSGFTVVDSGTSDTVPAGQTGILGIYLVPNPGQAIPLPGTKLSFTVTATSKTDSSITGKQTVTFTVPSIDAVSLTSTPVSVSSTPGTPTTATMILTNVGNVPASAALSFSTSSGLTLGGLGTTPIPLAVGQTVTETVQLTPGTNVPLNTTLQATVNVGPAPSQDVVSVVNVTPSSSFAQAGQTVTVSADVLDGVGQAEQAQASFTVRDGSGKVVFTSTAVPLTLAVLTNVATVNLGSLDTSALAPGQYTIQVSIDDSNGNAIPGATGTANLVIDAPVTASLAVSSDALNPETNTVSNTLTVGAQTLLGSVATGGEATSVALDGSLAYVATTQDIEVVNISDPTNPQLVARFGSSDVVQGGLTLVQLDGNNLIVTSEPTSSAQSLTLLVYSLTDPTSPQLLSNTAIPYTFSSGLAVQGNTAYITLDGIRYDTGSGNIIDQNGDVLAVDLSNPAAPRLEGRLFTDRGAPYGGNSNQFDVVPINGQVTYVAGSTSTGSSTQSGSGSVLVVNTANPAGPSVTTSLDIPGTVQALAIAVNGDEALVVGSTGGWQSPISDPSQLGLTGNVTLTLLNISNPLDPTILGSTVVTQDTLPNLGENATPKLQAVYLGNGDFAVSDTLAGGAPVLLVVNASNPANLLTNTVPAAADINGMAVAGDRLLSTSGTGLEVYQIGALTTQSATAEVTVPTSGAAAVVPGSFSVQPSQVIPGSGTETLVWDLTLAPGAAPQQITWETAVNGLAAGQVVAVAAGVSIQLGNERITIPASNVAGVPELQTIEIPVDVAAPGVPAIAGAATAAASIGNSGLSNQLNDLSTALTSLFLNPTSAVYLSQAQASLTSLISQVTGAPYLSTYTSALASAQSALAAATTPAQIDAAIAALGEALDSMATTLTDEGLYGFTLTLPNPISQALPGGPMSFEIDLTNNGTAAATYDLSVSSLPPNVTARFSATSVTVQPGKTLTGTNAPTLTLTESGDTLVSFTFTVTATAEAAPAITMSAGGQVVLRNESFFVANVTTNPPYTNPGGQVDVSAQLQTVVNEPTTVEVSYTVSDAGGNVLFTSSPVSASLGVTSALTTVDLGNLDTTGFANGSDTITVTVADQSGTPIPGATGQGTLVIGQPVTAALTTTPAVVPTGTSTVTNTLQVDGRMSFPNPLTLVGAASTASPGTSVALYQNYAYESGTGGIDIFDVSNPSNPTPIGTISTKDIVQGSLAFNVVRVVDNTLYLATTTTLNANQFNLLVYSLADPANPQFVSNTVIPYRFLTDLLVNSTGTAAFVPTDGYDYILNGTIIGQFGTFVSLDTSDPASPALSDVLFNNRGTPDGGNTNQLGGVLVNDQIAYVASTTSTGNNTQTGEGRVLVVNVADPGSMSLLSSLAIPDTNRIVEIGVQGHYALVVGSTGGWLDPFGSISNAGLTGHATLTLLDITNPQDPQIVGSTLVTQETFAAGESGQKVDAASLGNGDFLVSDLLSSGNPVVLLVDPTDPNNLAVSAISVPSAVHGITVSGDLMYATTAAGLSIYQVGQVISDPVTISVQVPTGSSVSGSFDDPPTITTSGTTDTLAWTRRFAFGSTSFTFTWQSTVSNIQAGQTQDVTLGTTVDFTSQGTPGEVTLPATSVTGVSIIAISPTSQSAQPGAMATYDVRLFNPGTTATTYHPFTSGLPQDWTVKLPGAVLVPANGSVDVPLEITSAVSSPLGTTSFSVIQGFFGIHGSASASLTLAGPPVLVPDSQSHGIVAALAPAQSTAGQGTSASYVVQLTNTGSADDMFSLALTGLPAGVAAALGESSIDVPPGATNFRDVPLELSVKPGTPTGIYSFMVTATSTTYSTVAGTTNGTLIVTAGGVQVTLTPGSGAPGSPFEATVTNTGTVADTYSLALGGPAALVSTLSTDHVTLGPGASQVVSINTGAVDFAVQGNLPLMAMATSTANPAIQGAASAALNIPATTGMTASFSPPSQTVTTPGVVTFVLTVQNTGNTEDSYSATITSTSGPVTANLVGLDGSPTQSIGTFILPGLSTGVIELQADISATGTGAIIVLVKSLDNPGSASPMAVAILSPAIPGNPGKGSGSGSDSGSGSGSGGTPNGRNSPTPTPSPTSSPGPRIKEVKRYGYHQTPTTVVLTFTQALDPSAAEDVHNYRIVGPGGQHIRVRRAVYDPARLTVTLHPAERLSIHHPYKLTVVGAGSVGVANAQHVALDSSAAGNPGTDDRITLTWRQLVLGHVSREFLNRYHIGTKESRRVDHSKTRPSTSVSQPEIVHPTGLFARSMAFPLGRSVRSRGAIATSYHSTR